MNRNEPRWILLVDDNPDICASAADIFADLGYAVDTAQDGTTALELVRRRPYDIALLDLKMPGMDGVTLCREIHRLRPETVSLLITAYAGAEAIQGAMEAGAWKVLSKPVDFPKLISLIGDALQRPLVLIVDDDPDLCDNLRDLLLEHSYRVSIAHDEREAMERLETMPRVAVIDLRLPGGDGGSVFRRVRAANASVRVMLITGYPDEYGALAQQLRSEGADALFFKPLDIPGFLADLGRLTGEAGGERP
jgi:CheY-like chemotaxis protein